MHRSTSACTGELLEGKHCSWNRSFSPPTTPSLLTGCQTASTSAPQPTPALPSPMLSSRLQHHSVMNLFQTNHSQANPFWPRNFRLQSIHGTFGLGVHIIQILLTPLLYRTKIPQEEAVDSPSSRLWLFSPQCLLASRSPIFQTSLSLLFAVFFPSLFGYYTWHFQKHCWICNWAGFCKVSEVLSISNTEDQHSYKKIIILQHFKGY